MHKSEKYLAIGRQSRLLHKLWRKLNRSGWIRSANVVAAYQKCRLNPSLPLFSTVWSFYKCPAPMVWTWIELGLTADSEYFQSMFE